MTSWVRSGGLAWHDSGWDASKNAKYTRLISARTWWPIQTCVHYLTTIHLSNVGAARIVVRPLAFGLTVLNVRRCCRCGSPTSSGGPIFDAQEMLEVVNCRWKAKQGSKYFGRRREFPSALEVNFKFIGTRLRYEIYFKILWGFGARKGDKIECKMFSWLLRLSPNIQVFLRSCLRRSQKPQ